MTPDIKKDSEDQGCPLVWLWPGERRGELVVLESAKALLLLLLLAGGLGCMPGEWRRPLGVWPPVPERCEEEREEQGDVVAPEPGVIPAEFSGVCRLIALKILFPFLPTRKKVAQENEKRMKVWIWNETGRIQYSVEMIQCVHTYVTIKLLFINNFIFVIKM